MSEDYYKRMYESVREDYPQIPAWEDLTEIEKKKIREANREYIQFMDNLGKSIKG